MAVAQVLSPQFAALLAGYDGSRLRVAAMKRSGIEVGGRSTAKFFPEILSKNKRAIARTNLPCSFCMAQNFRKLLMYVLSEIMFPLSLSLSLSLYLSPANGKGNNNSRTAS